MTTLPFTIDGEDTNHAFSSAVDQAVQYREAWFSIWTGLVAIADAIVAVCDGAAVTRTGANTITDAATDVIFGTATTQAHSWGIVRLGIEYIVWEANESNADATPQNASMYMGTSTYGTAGTTTTRDAAVTAARETAVRTSALIGWAAPASGYYNRFYSVSEQVMIWFSKAATNGGAASAFIVHRTDDSNTNGGDAPTGSEPRMCVFFNGSASNDSLAAAQLSLSTGWRACARDLTASATGPIGICIGWTFTGWTNGVDSGGQGEPFAILLGINTSVGRNFGYMRWMRGIPTTTPQNERDPADPGGDTHTWWSFDDVVLLWPKATGNIS